MEKFSSLPSSTYWRHDGATVLENSIAVAAEFVQLAVAIVDNMNQPGFVLNSEGVCIHENSMANVEFAGGILHLSPARRLIPVAFGDRFRWEKALQQAKDGKRSALVLRAAGELRSYSFRPCGVRSGKMTDLKILVARSRECPYDADILDSYSSAFALTPCETNALGLLCRGLAVSEIAKRVQVKESTIRSHVKSLLSKTNRPSIRSVQAELGRLSAV